MADERLLIDSNSRNIIGGATTGDEIRNVLVDGQGRIILGEGSATVGTVSVSISNVSLNAGSNTIGTVTVEDIQDGTGTTVMDITNRAVRVNIVAGGAGDGAIQDGANSAIEATVFDYTNSNPLAVVLRDTNGDYVSVGGGTQYTEDDASAANPVGNQLIARRRDEPLSGEVSAAGDVIALNATNKGELYVVLGASSATVGTVTIGTLQAGSNQIGTVSIQDGGNSITIDNSGITTIAGAVAGTEMQVDVITLPALASGANIIGTTTIQDGGNSITIDGTIAVSSIAAGDNNIGNVDIASAIPSGANTIGTVVITDGGNVISIDDNSSSITVDATNLDIRDLTSASDSVAAVQSGTWNVGLNAGNNTIGTVSITNPLPTGSNAIGKLAANSGVDIGDVDVLSLPALAAGGNTIGTATINGNVIHDGVDSGNPVKIGMKAVAHGSSPVAVAASDRTDWYANRHGIPFILGGHPNTITKRQVYFGNQTDSSVGTAIAGQKFVVTRASILADGINATAMMVRLGFGASTTPTSTATLISHPGLVPGSGIVEGNGGGILGIGDDGEDIRFTSSSPSSGTVEIIMSYFVIES